MEDVHYLAGHLRDSDVREIYALSGCGPFEALAGGLKLSIPHAWTLYEAATDRPILIGGVVDLSGDVAAIWLLTTPDLERYPVEITRKAKRMLRQMFYDNPQFHTFTNFVDTNQPKSVAWLKRLGCTILNDEHGNPLTIGPFRCFVFRREESICAHQSS